MIREQKWFAWGEPRPAVNPFPLARGVWAAELIAVNGAGNEARATVYLWEAFVRALGALAAIAAVGRTIVVVYNERKAARSL
jgi:hypothetical protein